MPVRSGLASAVLVWALASLPALAAEAPAGIVMAVAGGTDPPLAPMTEIAAGEAIKLAPDGRLTFLDYARCKLVTVLGGTLTLGALGYQTDGRVDSETDGPCPQTYAIAAADGGARTTAGMVMRGGAEPPRWPANMQFLLTGTRAGGFRSAVIYPEHKPESPVAAFAIADGKAVAAPGSLPPLANRRYVLRLSPSDPSKSTEIVFLGTAPQQPQPVVILRFD